MINPPEAKLILMADDDDDDRLLARDALNEARVGGELRFVQDGEELVEYLWQRGRYEAPGSAPRPGIILLDLNMPLKDGREALREIKSDPELRRIPVVVLTTSKADTDVGAVYALGANSFISKPFQFEAFVNVMKVLGDYWFHTVELPVSP